MRIINASETGTLVLGFQGEDQRLEIRFPLVDEKTGRNITEEFPGGSFSISIMLPGDPAEHIVGNEDFRIEGNWLIWTVKEPYTVGFGEGKLQLNYAFGGMVKSRIWKTNVRKSINSGSGTVPSWSDWKTELLNAAAAVESAVDSYDEMTAEAEELPEGSTPTAEMDHTGDHPVLHIGIPASQGGGGGDVQSVNGKTGVVVLNANDVGALPASTPIPPAVTVDSELSNTSTNPVQNKVIAGALSSQSETIVNLPQNRTSADSGMDLDISDESGHVLMRLADGEVKTKEFDSAKAAKMQNSIDSSADMDFVDPAGNVVLRVQDGHIQTKKFNSRNINPKIITLKADGTGDFPTLKAAIESITDADPDSNPYEIHVYPGTYDTLEGYTEEQIESADIGGGYTDNSFVGAKLTDGISLIGIGNRENIILTAELATADYDIGVRGNISTLNLQGSGRVENVSIHAENLRYCIHDDFGCDHIVRRTLKNVVFSGSNLSYDPFTSYGSGIPYGGMIALFEDCDFGFNFGMHTRQLMKVCSVVELRNCSGHQVILGDNANDNDVASHQFILNGCNFDSLKVSRTNGTTTPHMFISGTSKDMMIFEPGIYIVQTGDVVKTALTALDEGTLVAFATGAEKLTKAASAAVAYGVIVKKDTEYDYVQKSGFINAAWVGLTGLSIGDYVTVNSDMELVTGGTSSNAVGVVVYTHSTTAIIKLL